MRLNPESLLEIPDDTEVQCMVQEVKCIFNCKTASYLIYRDEEGEIYDIGKLFVNLPYLDDGVVTYDEDLTILDNAFNEEALSDLNFLQNIYDMKIGDVLENEVVVTKENGIQTESLVKYVLLANEVL